VALEDSLLKILVCPVDKGSLLYFEDEMALYNPRLRRRYAVTGNVPVMLPQSAEPVSTDEHDRLMRRADAGGAVRTVG
jgi:uncharacterized protein